ncbi:MAG: PAS domain S-box protein [Anaerolineae bacterium]|nr:PAS domain S-box protein [Anaerolineae bacterium]
MLLIPDYRVRQRDLLLEIIRAMTSRLDLAEVLRLVLKASVTMVGGEGPGLVALRNADTGAYRIHATLNIDGDRIPRLESQLQELVTGIQQGLDYHDLEGTLQRMTAEIDPRMRQLFPMPLVIADEPVGILIVFRDYPAAITVDDRQILRSFADHAAIAVHNARLYENIDRERQRLNAFVAHSADGVMILDAERQVLQLNPALAGMTGWSEAESLGRQEEEVLVWSTVSPGNLHELMDGGWPGPSQVGSNPLSVEGDILRRYGQELSIAITYVPLHGEGGQLANIFANVRDITHFRRAQELQNTFVSGVSHELKTPVALIKGYAGTLRREDADWGMAELREGLEVIEDEADRLAGLIDNLLEASRLQAQKMQLDLGPVDLVGLATRVVKRFQMQGTGHDFRLAFPEAFPVIVADEARLRRVMDNLLGNAVKYAPEGGQIEVGGQAAVDAVTLFVRDEGIGIGPEDQEQIFTRFYRVNDALGQRTQGTGLGLYLARAIVEAHGGTIGVDSRPGKGATFHFTLPREARVTTDATQEP